VSGGELQVAVVGHVEWVQFGHVARLPRAGAVEHASGAFEEPAGGGAVAAVALARLAGSCTLVTSLGVDEHARRTLARLAELGVEVRLAPAAGAHRAQPPPTRRAVTLIDAAGERSITTFGERLDPAGADDAAWEGLGALDGVYFTAGDLDALRRARGASRVLVASPRARAALGHGVALDALVLSANDELELGWAAEREHEAELVLRTEGAAGGRWRARDGREGAWRAAPVPGEVADAYGCGDTFAAGVTYGLAAGLGLDATLELAATVAAACLTRSGPYGRG
jgi:ribokinase